MAIPIEAYTAEGILTGVVDAPGRLRDALETLDELRLAPFRGLGLDGRRTEVPDARLSTDALLLVVPDEAELPVHATWHDVTLLAGPYLIEGQLPTLPGFDPGRALARPSGTFVMLRDVSVRLALDPERVLKPHQRLLVNRYDVDEVSSALMLGFFFPGARLDLRDDGGGTTPLEAGVAASEPATPEPTPDGSAPDGPAPDGEAPPAEATAAAVETPSG
jgi:hypothetical protein